MLMWFLIFTLIMVGATIAAVITGLISFFRPEPIYYKMFYTFLGIVFVIAFGMMIKLS